MSEHLIRRDTPLPRGTKIELHVTSYYTITLDEEIMDADDEALTLDEVWQCFDDQFESRAITEIEKVYKRGDSEGQWFMPTDRPQDPVIRFESAYEAEHPGPSSIRPPYVTLAEGADMSAPVFRFASPAGLIGQAFGEYAAELDALIDRIKRVTPYLALGFDAFSHRLRPWFVFDKANGSEVVGRFETVEGAEGFAKVHALRSGGVIDYVSFLDLGA